MANDARYILDANVFIEATRRYYSFELCPGFWECLNTFHAEGRVSSSDHVRAELLRGKDDLAEWAKKAVPSSFFGSSNEAPVIEAYAELVGWVQLHEQFLPEAKSEFASVADGWVVAQAMALGLTVVTHEVYDPNIKKKVKIPNVCREFGVPCIDTFRMLSDLGVQFSWNPTA